MADKYDSNGDYNNYSGSNSSDFKRKSLSDMNNDDSLNKRDHDDQNDESNPASQKAAEYVRELLAEKIILDQGKFPNAARLVDQEVAKVQQIGKAPLKEYKYVDIYREKPIKVSVKVLVPVREHPKFNFVGKLLGPKGNSMKRLQEETMCKMAVLGRGSMKDRAKEEELRNSLDPKYAHLSDDLHVEICALGPPAEAHARVAYALAEVRKYLIPDNNDNIRQEQMREMEIMSGDPAVPGGEKEMVRGFKRSAPPAGSILRALIEQQHMMKQTALNGFNSQIASKHPGGPPAPTMRVASARPPGMVRAGPVPPPSRPPAPGSSGGAGSPRVMPAKAKIMSILDRARVAMEESYGYGDPSSAVPEGPYGHREHHHHAERATYVEYAPPPPTISAYSSSHHYDDEYDPPEYYPSSSKYHEPADPYETSHRSWKSYKPTSSSSTRHHESSRYRSSPYTRPSK